MCLIGVAWRSNPKFDLVITANRDEFHQRPSAAAAAWTDHPHIFGGRDLSQKGSWLAASTKNRMAAVTNVRRMVPPNPGTPSRGKLVAEFLAGEASAVDYAQSLAEESGNFAGFNLLLYDGEVLLFVSNAPEFRVQTLAPGVHTLSNASLDTPWPKSRRLHTALEAWSTDSWESFAPLFKALADRTPAADSELPSTGMGKSMEKMLSPPFIVSPNYGTRCSTIAGFGGGKIDFWEKRFEANGLESGHTQKRLATE